ncbi:MAG: hypothetical protein WAM60_14180 [Candidatus Promineifilaceae bacterium]
MESGEIIGLVVGFVLTLCIFSFVLGDNPLYRFAVHLLVGVSAGYAAVLIVQSVLWPVFQGILENPTDPGSLAMLFPLLLSLLLLLKMVPRIAWLGNSSMAFLMAIGAAVGLVGAITGTLIPMITSTYDGGLGGMEGAVVSFLVGILTVCTLLYFHFTGRLMGDGQVVMPFWQRYAGLVGQIVITITLAALFAATLSTSLVLLSSRVGFFIDAFGNLFSTLFS